MTTRSFPNLKQTLLCVSLMGTACSATPVVKPTCTISWDRSVDSRVAEYHVTVWGVTPNPTPMGTTHVVTPPTTEVSCQKIGTNKPGTWQAMIQACLNDGNCGVASNMILFKVAEK